MVRWSVAWGWLAVGAACSLASCADLPEPELGSQSTSDIAELDAAAPVDGVEQPQSVDRTEVVSPNAPVSPELIIATGSEIAVGPPSGLTPLTAPVADVAADLAVDDHLGGIVAQLTSGEVWWFPGEGGLGQLINGEGGMLLDVGLREATPSAILLVDESADQRTGIGTETEGPDATRQRIDLVELVTGQRTVLATLDPGRTLRAFSAGGEVYAVLYGDAGCGGFLLTDTAGIPLDIVMPLAVCPVADRPAFGGVALNPDGNRIVFTEVTYRPDGVEATTVLVGRDLTTAEELFRLEVGGPTDRLSSLAFDGQRVVLLRTSLDPEVESGPVLVDLADSADPLVIGRSDARSVSFARRPLSVG